MRRKLLSEYIDEHGPIRGISPGEFNSAIAQDILEVICQTCGQRFESKKQVLAARFNRGSKIRCKFCVNTENINKRYEDE